MTGLYLWLQRFHKNLSYSQVVTGTPDALIPYMPLITEVLDETLHLECKEGYELSTQLLSNILYTFSDTFPINCYEHNNYVDPSKCDILPIRVRSYMFLVITG